MRRVLFLLSLILLQPAPADTLEDGVAAYSQGDYASAAKILAPIADDDPDGHAHYLLGNMFADGLGVAGDMEKALDWYERAVRRQHRQAAMTLGKMYMSGHGVPWDTRQGIHYIELADSFPTFDPPEDCE